jgi:predicted PurR-regulated permease PerM
MLGIDRRALYVTWTLFLFGAALAILYTIRNTLMIFVLALFLAHLLSPLLALAERFFPRRVSRTVALGAVYLVLMGVLAAIAIPVGSRIAAQAATLAGKLPGAIEQNPLGHVPLPNWLEPERQRLAELLRNAVEDLNRSVLPSLTRAGTQILTGIGSLLSLILIPILSFLFLKDGPGMRRVVVESFEADARELVDGLLSDLHLVLAKYIRALVLLSIATFLFYLAFLAATGVPYAILLAGVAALLEFIPVFGPLTAGVAILLLAVFSGYPHWIWILIFLVIYRVIQDYMLSPYLMSSGVEVHPILVLFGVLAGEQLAGVPGMFFSVPVIAALRLILERMQRRRLKAEIHEM